MEFGEPDCKSMFASNELAVTVSNTEPTEVAASLVFVMQSPWAGLFVPSATVDPEDRIVIVVDWDVDVDVEGELLEQADAKARMISTTTEGRAMNRWCGENCIPPSSAAPSAQDRDFRVYVPARWIVADPADCSRADSPYYLS